MKRVNLYILGNPNSDYWILIAATSEKNARDMARNECIWEDEDEGGVSKHEEAWLSPYEMPCVQIGFALDGTLPKVVLDPYGAVIDKRKKD